MEQKNFLLAMGLIASFLILWSVFVVPRFAPPPGHTPAGASGEPVGQPGGGVAPPQTPELKSAHAEMGEPIVLSDTILRDENNEIVLTPTGGAVKNWRLKLKGQEVDLVLNPDVDVLPLASFPDANFKITTVDRQAVMEGTLSNGVRVTKTLTLSPSGHLHQISYRFRNPTSVPLELSKWSWGLGPGLGTAPGEIKENARLTRPLTLVTLE